MRRAVLVSFLGVAAVTGCASGHSSGKAGVVSWVNRPLPLYHVPSPQPIRYPATAPPCRGGQLRVSTGRGGAATGHLLEELVFTNVGLRPCLLRGYPTISAETPAGTRRVLHPRHGTFFMPLVAADPSHGRHVFLDVETDDVCRGGEKPVVRYRQLVFGLPQGGRVTGGKVSIDEQCGLAISAFGLRERFGPLPRSRTGTPGTLQAFVHLPGKLRAGTKELSYVVTLSNTTARPVRFAPCPGYTEDIYAKGLVVRRSFALNCDAVRVIRAHESARYAMRLTLPHPLPRGAAPVKLSWNLDTANGPFVGRGLLVAGS